MTISSALTALNTDIQNARAAITNKGGTVTSGGGSSQLATDIATIPTGGGSGTGIPREVSAQGIYQSPTTSFTFSLPSNATTIEDHALSYAFYGSTGLTSADLSSIVTVEDDYGMGYVFYKCTSLTNVNLSSLKTIGSHGLYYAFRGCVLLTSINLSSLVSVSSNGLAYAFWGNTSLTNMNFPSLSSITGTNALNGAFTSCTSLKNIYFPALTTTSFGSYVNQFNNMMNSTGSTTTHTIHFPSNLSSTISGLTGYPLFGGTSGYVTLAFDLTATS